MQIDVARNHVAGLDVFLPASTTNLTPIWGCPPVSVRQALAAGGPWPADVSGVDAHSYIL